MVIGGWLGFVWGVAISGMGVVVIGGWLWCAWGLVISVVRAVVMGGDMEMGSRLFSVERG